MQRKASFKVLMLIVLLFGLIAAASTTLAAEDGPRITAFTTSLSVVDKTALANRSARVPVSWTTERRPVYANLFFEQVMPDGSVINVELPRLIPWVNSNGDGMAAPILPRDDSTQIELRVRLVNLLNNQVLDEKKITLPVGVASGQGAPPTARPAITDFATSSANVSAAQLANRTARVPVSWNTVYRPTSANLIFEQILADGSVVNVELPRENPWVASAGNGVAAPVPPGGEGKELNLRLRLVDLLTGRVFDQRSLRITIGTTPSQDARIAYFTTNAGNVSATELAQRTARIPVSWSVDNRPDGSNLVFEQVLGENRIVNVELPRTVPLVPSSGNGVAAPVLPESGDSIRLRVRLVNLANNTTITTRELTIPIQGRFSLTAEQLEQAAENMPVNIPVETNTDASPVTPEAEVTPDVVEAEVCNHTFFYGENADDCATTPVSELQMVVQTFERGMMLWRADRNEIWVLPGAGAAMMISDTWNGSDAIVFDQPAPEGRYLPERGFGHLWTTNSLVRDLLGWATGPEQGYTAQVQSGAAGGYLVRGSNLTFISLPDGRILQLYHGAATTWSILD